MIEQTNPLPRRLFDSWVLTKKIIWLSLELNDRYFDLPCTGFIKYEQADYAIKFRLNERGGIISAESLTIAEALRQEALVKTTVINVNERVN